MEADTKVHPLVVRDRGIAFGHTSLDRDRAGKRLDHTRKLRQQTVAGGFDDATLVFGDLRIDELAAMGSQPRQRTGLIMAHQPAISGDIGGEDGRQPALDPLSAHWPAGPAK